MNPQADAVSNIESRIARRRERIARWDKEAGEVEALWTGGPVYRMFCEGMAATAREKKAALETELSNCKDINDAAVRGGEAPCYTH